MMKKIFSTITYLIRNILNFRITIETLEKDKTLFFDHLHTSYRNSFSFVLKGEGLKVDPEWDVVFLKIGRFLFRSRNVFHQIEVFKDLSLLVFYIDEGYKKEDRSFLVEDQVVSEDVYFKEILENKEENDNGS